jgi:hypothetical protein
MGFMASGHGAQFQCQSSLFYGLSEYLSRPLAPAKNPSIRMDSKQSGNKQTVQHLGNLDGRSVFIQRQSQSSTILLVDPCQQALAMDALTITWSRMLAYAYPPICLILKVLQHIAQSADFQVISITSLWLGRHWYTTLLQYLIAPPIQ